MITGPSPTVEAAMGGRKGSLNMFWKAFLMAVEVWFCISAIFTPGMRKGFKRFLLGRRPPDGGKVELRGAGADVVLMLRDEELWVICCSASFPLNLTGFAVELTFFLFKELRVINSGAKLG